MQSVLDYITRELKLQKKTTISAFIEDQGYTRTSFYRMMGDPGNITPNDILGFVEALKLSPPKEREFRRLVRYSASGYSEAVHKQILGILYSEPHFIREKAAEVEFFSTETERNRIVNTYGEIVEQMTIEQGATITIKILNCLSRSALISLYTLICELRKRVQKCPDEIKSSLRIIVEHVATVGEVPPAEKIEVLFSVAQMIQFSDYSVYLLNYVESMDDGKAAVEKDDSNAREYLENKVLIRINDARYYIFQLSNVAGARDYCFSTEDKSYYNFHRIFFNSLRAEVEKKDSFNTIGAAAVSAEIASLEKPYRKLLIKTEPCLDNILPDIWDDYSRTTLAKRQDMASQFREKTDPHKQFAFLSNEAFYKIQLEYLADRFHTNEHPGSINIYDVQGFAKFIETGFTLETKDDLPPFSPNNLKLQLEYMIQQISEHYGDSAWQQFYFFRKSAATSDLFMDVFDTKGICVINEQCIDLVNANFFYTDPEIARLLYEVVAGSLPSDEILTQDESLNFLRGLLERIEMKIKSS